MEKDAAHRVSPRAITLPRLYAILDAGVLARQKMEIAQAAAQLRETVALNGDRRGEAQQLLAQLESIPSNPLPSR